MRVAHPSVWFQKSNKTGPRPPPDTTTDHLPAPTNKGDTRPSSTLSLLTSYAHRSTPTLNTSHSHPFAIMAHAPLPVVSSHDSSEDEEDCPVCLEPLSFSFRLPGEKPHIVPECGHALHEVCVSPLLLPCLLLVSSLVALEAQVALLSECLHPHRRRYSTLRSPSTTLVFPPPLPHLRARARSVARFLPDSLIPLTILFGSIIGSPLTPSSIGLLYRRVWTCSRGKSRNCGSAQVKSGRVRCL